MNCIGCMNELEYAYELQEQGYYLATYQKNPNSFPNHKGHLSLIVIDYRGRVYIL